MLSIVHNLLPEFRPSEKLLRTSVAFCLLGIAIGALRIFWPDQNYSSLLTQLWLYLGLIAVVFVLYDLYRRHTLESIEMRRVLPQSFALNRQQKVVVNIENNSDEELNLSFHEDIPAQLDSSSFPMQQRVTAGQVGQFQFSVTPKQRGPISFAKPYLLISSPFGFWQSIVRPKIEDSAKVYPDFSAVSNSFVLGIEQAMRHLGANLSQRRGDGLEFNQLREFRDGDTLKQVDWKATARLNTPISREFREEKDQNVVFLLDCSRRMRATEQDLSYFDYALNALLISSYIALDKGDAVGVLTFSGEQSWLPPIKGKTSINQLLNHLYALDTSTQSSDYVSAAEDLMKLHRKRSLVILLTNVRDEDDGDLRDAVRIMSKRHLVMVVALQEGALSNVESLPLDSQDDVMLYSGVKLFQQSRAKMLAGLRARGVSVVDANHQNLHVQLVNEYLRLKHSGKI